jgi:hypothetical protein
VAGRRESVQPRPGATAGTSGPLPTFLIIGAMRCGTTTLARSLGAHPEVFVPPQKEIHYFDRHLNRGVDWYRAFFAGVSIETVLGEATPAYMYEPDSPRRIAGLIPDAQLLCILRNPVDRAYSHYWLERGLGREPLEFREALEAEPDRRAADRSPERINHAYLDCSRYLPQLERVCQHFPREALHVVILEEFEQDPAGAYRHICRFLRVSEGFIPSSVGQRLNRYREYHSLRLRRAVRTGGRGLVKRVLGRLNVRSGSTYPPMDPDLREDLVRRFSPHNEELGRWLGKDLSRWDR